MDFVKGQLVRSKAGRDKGRLFAVIGIEGQMLFLADGSLRKLDRPKAKKIRHVAPTATVLQGVSLATDKQLAAALRDYDALHPAKP